MEYYFEDFKEGDVYRTMHRTMTEYDLMSFVTLTGYFEEIFLNADFARQQSVYGKRIVPGPLIFILSDGLYIQTRRLENGIAFLGLTDLKVLTPVAVGDTLHQEVLVEKTRTTHKPGRGIVSTYHKVVNQEGTAVMEYRTDRMIRSRTHEAAQ